MSQQKRDDNTAKISPTRPQTQSVTVRNCPTRHIKPTARHRPMRTLIVLQYRCTAVLRLTSSHQWTLTTLASMHDRSFCHPYVRSSHSKQNRKIVFVHSLPVVRVARSTLPQWEVECSFDSVVQIANFDLRCSMHGYLWCQVSNELHENARLSLTESIPHASGLIPG